MKIEYTKNIHGEDKKFDIKITEEDKFYKVECLSGDEEMGFITFKVLSDHAWIYKLETKEKFAHQGVASAVVDIAEYIIAVENSKNQVEAKYMPDNEFALPFYQKNGYYVPNQTKSWDDYDETWRMFKMLDKNEIRERVEKNIEICQEDDVEKN